MPAGSAMAANSHTVSMITQTVALLLAWIAPKGEAAMHRCESAKEALNRGCQLLSVHGSWSWLPKKAWPGRPLPSSPNWPTLRISITVRGITTGHHDRF